MAAARDPNVVHAVADAVECFDVPVMGMCNTQHEEVYTARGLQFLAKYYTDLDYNDDGTLILTRVHTAVDADEAARRCSRVIEEGRALS